MTSQLPQRSKPLYEQTYLALRSAILTGEIAVNERLIESQLAQRFQVSRTPVREAIRRLQQENLLASDGDGALHITKLSLHDAIKLYDCRIALEQLSVVGACENATAEQLKAIEQTLIQAESLAQRGHKQLHDKLLDFNFDFHRLIAESSDNPWLVPLLDHLSSHTRLLRTQTLQTEPDITNIHREHRQVYEAIAHHDAPTAVKYITHHLAASQQRIIEIFERSLPISSAEKPQQEALQCPRCLSFEVSRNGRRMGKQGYICKQCGRQFLATYESSRYSAEIQQKCITLHNKGIGFREIEKLTGVNHNTIIRWVKSTSAKVYKSN
ncbi:FCD domain-containing protein [Gloeocapsopsis sp. IPPAS B-1203]|uniref:FCD domain-containing protein n=1 Tax=Gloeocapsopsis sp. IPPAS B-1203 TaxID=2049454 RepID=UPI0025A11F3F|nr:FCD domain-containing protein [Gloeocapsopsis sp. IPPAS B-1203]